MEEQERLLREAYEADVKEADVAYMEEEKAIIQDRLQELAEEIKHMEGECKCGGEGHAREVSKQDSVKVARNAKGDYSWEVKLYFDNETEPYADTLNRLDNIADELRRGYGN